MPYKFLEYTSNSKISCPACVRDKSFSRYYDTSTNKVLDRIFGRCDREISCGYHYSPNIHPPTPNQTTNIIVKPKPESNEYNLVPQTLLTKSLKNQFLDNFSQFIIHKFGEKGKKALIDYDIGYSKIFDGAATIFWQRDIDDNIRSGKIIKYDLNGKRVKKPYPLITWVHTSFAGEYKLEQCLFGEHLLKTNLNKIVCVVESEKTSIILSILKPNYIWLSCGQLQGLNLNKLKVLQGRLVIFHPDKGVYKIWRRKLMVLKKDLDFKYKVSSFVERQGSLKDGDDLVDFL